MDRPYEDQNSPRSTILSPDQVRLMDGESNSSTGKKMSGRLSDIALSFSIITIPMLMFTGVLLGLVYFYRVTHGNDSIENLRFSGDADEPGVYYVNISATVLIFIASWSSSLATFLTSSIMALAAYPIAGQYLRDARSHNPQLLLTPFQFGLTPSLTF